MLGTYFYHEIIRKTIVSFGTLFNDIYIRHLNKDGSIADETKVGLSYGPTQKFLAKIRQQEDLSKPIAITLPRMSFEMIGLQYDGTRKTSVTQTFKACDDDGNIKKVDYVKNMFFYGCSNHPFCTHTYKACNYCKKKWCITILYGCSMAQSV